MNIQLDCENVQVTPGSYKYITVELEGVEKSDILDNFNIEDILKHFDVSDILDEIGLDNVKSHFDLDSDD